MKVVLAIDITMKVLIQFWHFGNASKNEKTKSNAPTILLFQYSSRIIHVLHNFRPLYNDYLKQAIALCYLNVYAFRLPQKFKRIKVSGFKSLN